MWAELTEEQATYFRDYINRQMEQSQKKLRLNLIAEIAKIDKRTEQLSTNIEEYKQDEMYESAIRSNIKRDQLIMVSNNLKKIL